MEVLILRIPMIIPAPLSDVWEEIFYPFNGGNTVQDDALMRYSEAVGDATDLAAREELPATLIVACLTRFIDVVVRCADYDNQQALSKSHEGEQCTALRYGPVLASSDAACEL